MLKGHGSRGLQTTGLTSLTCKHEVLYLGPGHPYKAVCTAHACNPSTGEAERGESLELAG